jgi:hypothetical protein
LARNVVESPRTIAIELALRKTQLSYHLRVKFPGQIAALDYASLPWR